MADVSARHALLDDEIKFVRMWLALGEKNATEAYRRAFLVQDGNQWFKRGAKGERSGAPVTSRWITKEASVLLKKDHIQRYVAELKAPASDTARSTLVEQVRFGDSQEALRAANRILDDEDKLGFRDAAEMWADIMCEVGAEVVVPLPGKVEDDVICPNCFETHHVELPIEVSVPMGDMFPNYGKGTKDDQEGKGEVRRPVKGGEEARDARFSAKGGSTA